MGKNSDIAVHPIVARPGSRLVEAHETRVAAKKKKKKIIKFPYS